MKWFATSSLSTVNFRQINFKLHRVVWLIQFVFLTILSKDLDILFVTKHVFSNNVSLADICSIICTITLIEQSAVETEAAVLKFTFAFFGGRSNI